MSDCSTPTARPPQGHILSAIYTTEQQLNPESPADDAPPKPISLNQLQRDLNPSELFVEYVLADPHSYALAITGNTVRRYTSPSKDVLEQEATQYRSELMQQKTDLALGQQLFDGFLGGMPEFKEKHALIVVPDGKLQLLPFAALVNSGQYILTSHLVTVAPSGTVLDILMHRSNQHVAKEYSRELDISNNER